MFFQVSDAERSHIGIKTRSQPTYCRADTQAKSVLADFLADMADVNLPPIFIF